MTRHIDQRGWNLGWSRYLRTFCALLTFPPSLFSRFELELARQPRVFNLSLGEVLHGRSYSKHLHRSTLLDFLRITIFNILTVKPSLRPNANQRHSTPPLLKLLLWLHPLSIPTAGSLAAHLQPDAKHHDVLRHLGQPVFWPRLRPGERIQHRGHGPRQALLQSHGTRWWL